MRSTIVQFADTNILLYAISRDPAETDKAKRANELLTAGDIGLSVQVLQEFYVQATRASRADAITHEQATGLVEAWRRFPVQDLTVEIMVAAFETRRRFAVAYRDAAIIEASRVLGCAVVLSEDLDVGTDYDGVRVQNPFAPDSEVWRAT
jgi:predicted nucleic acid-binding protein